MSRAVINVGAVAGDHTGDPGRTAMQSINANFAEVYTELDIGTAESGAGVTPTNYGYRAVDPRRYGAAVDGSTDDSTPIQNAVDVWEYQNKGGLIALPQGTLLVATGITMEKNGLLMTGCGAGGDAVGNNQGTTLKYTGNVAGLTMGVSGGGRWNVGAKNFRVDVGSAGSSAVGVQCYAVRHPRLTDMRVVTTEGASSSTGQTGVRFDGQGAFCGWGLFDGLFVKGDFAKGIHLKGNAASNGLNSSVFNGGGVYNTGSSIQSGSIGVYVEQGASDFFLGFDLTGWESAVRLGASATKCYFVVRQEFGSSTTYLLLDSGATYNYYFCKSHTMAGVTDNSGNTTNEIHVQADTNTYTPTGTNVTNLSASTMRQCTYSRVGNTVHVAGQVDVDPTGAGACELGISLPITSALTTAFQLGGTGAAPAVAGFSVAIDADAANDRARMRWVAVDTANQTVCFAFAYQVL